MHAGWSRRFLLIMLFGTIAPSRRMTLRLCCLAPGYNYGVQNVENYIEIVIKL